MALFIDPACIDYMGSIESHVDRFMPSPATEEAAAHKMALLNIIRAAIEQGIAEHFRRAEYADVMETETRAASDYTEDDFVRDYDEPPF